MISTAATTSLGVSGPATLGISAAALAAELLIQKYVGQGRRAADAWIQSGNGQNAFLENVLKPASVIAQTDPQKASGMVAQGWQTYLQGADAYASMGPNQARAVQQNLTSTPAFTQTVGKLLGKDPMSPEFTQPFLGKAGSTIGAIFGKIGGTIATGLGKVMSRPNVGATPPYSSDDPGAPSTPIAPGSTPSTGLTAADWAQLGLTAAGGVLSNRAQTSTQVTTPTESPAFVGLGEALRQTVQSRLNQPLPPAYETNGIKTINDTYGSIAQGLHNQLTTRGLSSSPVAGNADTNLALRRGGDIVNFQNNLPLVQNDLQNQNIGQAMQLYNAGRGSTSTSTTPGNVLGGGFKSVAQMMAYLHGQQGKPLSMIPAVG